jgi:imidazolonepropionase-like amidohydrolase
MGVEQVYVDAFNRAKTYQKEWASFNGASKKQLKTMQTPRRDLELEALVEILNDERYITCHSYIQSEITMLMNVADSMGFRINTFTHILEGYKVADKMKEHGAYASTFSDWWAYKFEVNDAIPYNAAILTKQGVLTAINSDDAEMGMRLNQEAAKTIKYGGMTEVQALNMITINPAKMLHIDKKVGSIAVGKDADLVLWSGNPLSVYSHTEMVMIDGMIYFSKEKNDALLNQNKTERQRLIQAMALAKKAGAKMQKVKHKSPHLYHCDSYEDECEF